jgi:hypothetical protein
MSTPCSFALKRVNYERTTRRLSWRIILRAKVVDMMKAAGKLVVDKRRKLAVDVAVGYHRGHEW